MTRGDLPAAVTLLARAVALLPDSHEERREILPMLGSALMGTGDFGRAERVLDEALETARSAGDQRLELRTVIEREFFRAFTSPESSVDEIVAVADSAIPLLEQLGDDLGLAKAWWLKSEVHVNACRWGARAESLERALHHARRAGDSGGAATISALLAQALHYGPAPVPQAIVRCEELLSHSRDSALTAAVSSTLAALRAMQREFDEARRLWADARSNYDELGLRLRRAARSLIPAEIETLAGNPEEAVRMLRWAHDTLDEMGVVGLRATITAFLADSLYEAGDPQGARRFAQAAEELGAPDDLVTQVMWRIARSKVEGDSELADEALRLADTTDYPDLKARALVAAGELERARTIYEAKGNVAAAERLLARQGASS